MADLQCFIDSLINTFETGSGYWSPLMWGLAIIIVFLIVYILRGYGRKDYKEGTGQTQAFLSGNPEYEKEQMHIKGANVFWGFTESLKWLYQKFEKMHTGNVSDYALWFVVIMGIFFIVLGVI